jgi:hypothetical protein
VGSKRKVVHTFLILRVWGGRITFSTVIVKSTTNIEQLFLLLLLDEIFTEDTAVGKVAGNWSGAPPTAITTLPRDSHAQTRGSDGRGWRLAGEHAVFHGLIESTCFTRNLSHISVLFHISIGSVVVEHGATAAPLFFLCGNDGRPIRKGGRVGTAGL